MTGTSISLALALAFVPGLAFPAEQVLLLREQPDVQDGRKIRYHMESIGSVAGARRLAVPESGGHVLLLTDRGEVMAWGDNRAGQLGVGDLDPHNGFVRTPVSDAAAIAAAASRSFALRRDGTVWSWGGNEPTPAPVAGLWEITSIAAASHFLLAQRGDGTVWMVGNDGAAAQVPDLWNVSGIAARQSSGYAMSQDGRVWVFGPGAAPKLLENDDSGLLAELSRRFSPNARGLRDTEWLGVTAQRRIVRVTGLGLEIQDGADAQRQPVTGALLDIDAGWAIGLITMETPVEVSSAKRQSTESAKVGAEREATSQTALIGGGVVRLSSSSPLIDANENHGLYLVNGRACGFGNNENGQLGDGTAVDRWSPVPAAAMTNLTVISSGLYHSAGLKSDGTVYTWGYNAYGQLGDGTTNSRLTPFPIAGLTNIIDVAVGSYHTLVLKSDGTVWSFGYNGYGNLGDGTSSNRTTAVQVIGLTGITAVAAGEYFSLALKNDGTVWAWGYNSHGQLGDGTFAAKSNPVQVAGLTGVTAIGAGTYHVVVRKSDGTVWGWGYNGYSQLGDGSATSRPNPVRAGTLTGIVSVAGGDNHSLAVKDDGTVWSWGRNHQGQLGDGSITTRTTPVQVSGFTGASAVAAGAAHSIAVKTNGTIWSWGDNAKGQLGNGTTTDSSVAVAASACAADPVAPPAPNSYYKLLSAHETHSLAVRSSDGAGFGWGLNTNSELGDGTSTNRTTPVQTSGTSALTGISAGLYHGAAARSDGTVRTWGYNAYGQLGDGTTVAKTAPVTPTGLTNIVAAAAGGYHTLALRSDGVVFAFGYNGYGNLGDGSTTNRTTAVQVIGLTGITAIAAGEYFSLALKNDGTVWAWGYNAHGQLGDGTFTAKSSPVQVANLTGVTAIRTGTYHALALKSDGTVWGWGYNGYSQLGEGDNNNRPNIVRVSGLTGVVGIGAGENHSLAVKSDGTVWAWGRNHVGQLGDGSVATRSTPVQTMTNVPGPLTGVVAVAAGSAHSLALKSNGEIWVFGTNAQGQFGVTSPANTTVAVLGPTGFTPAAAPQPPVITSISPNSATAGSAAFNLDVTGSNFTAQSVVRWNGANRTTTMLNATTLRAVINAGDVASAGTATVTVFDPNGTSNGVTFTINAAAPPPGAPNTPVPSDTATGQALSLTLVWSATNATSYDVYFGTAATPPFVATVNTNTYNPGTLTANTLYRWRIVAKNGVGNTTGPTWSFTTGSGGITPSTGLRFNPVPPCRVVDTRAGQGTTGAFGPPTPNGAAIREVPIPAGRCTGIPTTAAAYSVNVTVVPHEPLGFLSMWPTGEAQPLVSTLNSFHAGVVANAAIVPAGTNGAISFYVTNLSDVIIDINGYFDSQNANALSFYTVTPCRLGDSRTGQGFSGAFGPPSLAGNTTRSWPLPGNCGLPQASAYSLNFTVAPQGPLGYLTAFPTGQTQPFVSTLNSFDATVVANAALVPAGTGGAISTFVTDNTDAIIDVNGYFGARGAANELQFYKVTPCRLADTRLAGQGAPIMAGNSARDFAVAGKCGIPADARAYSLNVTVVPSTPLGFLTLWPTGSTRPLVSTLNSFLGRVVANAALVPSGTGGSVSVFVTNDTHVILDINGYFK